MHAHDDTTDNADRRLLDQARDGDPHAFTPFYARHRDWCLTYAHARSSSWQTSEDAVQDVFVQLINSIDRITITGSVRAYLAASVRNALATRSRTKLRLVAAEPDQLNEHHTREASTTAPATDSAERDARVRRGMERLPAEQQEVLRLWAAGLTHVQIAQIVDAPLGTVKSRARLGLDTLGNLLGAPPNG